MGPARAATALAVASVAFCACIPTGASGTRRLAVVVRADAVDLPEVDAVLNVEGMARDVASTFDTGAGVNVIEVPLSATSGGRLFAVAGDLAGRPGVLAAGELLLSESARRLVYSGSVVVQLAEGASRPALEAWANRHGLTREGADLRERNIRFRAPLDPASLLAAVADLPGAVGRVTPIHHDVRPPRVLTEGEIGGYHLIFPLRNVLAVVREAGTLSTHFDDIVENATLTQTVRDVEFYEFSDEDLNNDLGQGEMLEAQRQLKALPFVTSVGPAISFDPPRWLSGELIVAYENNAAAHAAATMLAFYGLTELRELPYLENGHLYEAPEASHALYTMAHDLLADGGVELAVPNVISENRKLCDSGDCTPDSHQEYLGMIRAPGAWQYLTSFDRDTVIGLLDEGFRAIDGTAPCSDLRVAGMLDTNSSGAPTCFPTDEGQWCDPESAGGCGDMILNSSTHAVTLALAAAAKLDPIDSTCESLVGVAQDARLLDVEYPSSSSDTEIASALWWMAGGVETGYATPLTGDRLNRRATVLNLSFARSYSSVDCPAATLMLCAPVCGTGATCSLLDAVLERLASPEDAIADLREADGLRREGTLIVAAMRKQGIDNDFASADYTVGVGAVTTAGKPFSSSTMFHPHTDYLEVVVPMGADEGSNINGSSLPAGGSSAATAAVSGVAALMFDANPNLTAAQAGCILSRTAQRPLGSGEMWHEDEIADWPHAGCRFAGIGNYVRSDCVGYGMVDACAAVRSADACHECTLPVMSMAGELLEYALAPCTKLLPYSARDPEYSCPCDGYGTRLDGPFELADTSFCLNCDPDDKFGEVLDEIMELLGCFRDEVCLCDKGPDCLSVDIVNETETDIEDVMLKVCVGSTCKVLPGEWPPWPAGSKLTIPIPHDFDVPLSWRAGRNATLQVYSGTERVEFLRPEEVGVAAD